ncbi:hypothetical protein Avbf_10370, partial [Armadillidium vulgare]
IGEFPIGFLKGFNRFLLENSRVYISFRGNFVWENPYWKSPISYLNSSPFPHEKRYGSCTNFPTCLSALSSPFPSSSSSSSPSLLSKVSLGVISCSCFCCWYIKAASSSSLIIGRPSSFFRKYKRFSTSGRHVPSVECFSSNGFPISTDLYRFIQISDFNEPKSFQ